MAKRGNPAFGVGSANPSYIDHPGKATKRVGSPGWNVRTEAVPHDYHTCNRPNQAGAPCGLRAGIGTKHLNEEGFPCFKHRTPEEKLADGVSAPAIPQAERMGMDSHQFMSGMFTKITIPEITAMARDLSENRDVFDTRDHIHLLESMIVTAINIGKVDMASKLIVEATKAIQRLHDTEEGRKMVIHINDINSVLERVAEIVFRHVPDGYTRGLIAQELKGLHLRSGSGPALIAKPIEISDGREG